MQLETTMRDALANAFDDRVNLHASAAYLQLETSADAEVATFTFQDPAFGAASTGVITLLGVPIQDTSATGGTVAQGSISAGDAAKLAEAAAATSGQPITVSSVTIAAAETVTLTSLTVTVPAGP